MVKQFKSKYARRGQAAVMFALLIPLLLLFVGVGLDLGWYYLNVSRLQNAADAAVIAGAQALADDLNEKAHSTTYTSTTTSTSEYATTTTNTNITTTTTYTYESLVDKYPENPSDKSTEAGDKVAEEYVVKNLGTKKDINFGTAEAANIKNSIIDSWSKSKNDTDRVVTPTYSLYEYDDKFYYVVKLTENIEHLFLPGWFDSMNAPVVAVALISKGSSSKTFIEKLTELLEKAKNENVIVGNWEVQDKYKDISGGSYTITLKAGDYLIDSSGHVVVDEDGNPVINEVEGKKITLTRAGKFYLTFGSDYYTGAWNHFQDFYNHYYLGDLYRKQMVVIKDDVIYEEDSNGVDIIDRNGTKGTITSYGKGKYGESSSVAATVASINTDASSSGYNPKHDGSEKKTYQDGISASDNKGDSKGLGYPFTWKRLDSINIDFRPEVTLSGKWLSEDWDLELYDLGGVSPNGNARWEKSTKANEGLNKINDNVIKRLRIHTSMNFENPYKVRPDVDTDAEPDVLWARIESEPILYKPDVTDSSNLAGLSSIVSTTTLNSVNQIILNFNQSNYNTNDQRYRPVIIFYDGPETYDNVLASYKAKPDIELEPNNSAAVLHRKSKPVIVNLNAPYRGILYAPNSPVVVIGTEENKSKFKGFIVAEKYMELKDDDDFISAEEYLRENNQSDLIYTYAYRYFNNVKREYEYNRKIKADGTIGYQDVGVTGDKYSSMVKKDTDAYRLKVYYAKDDTETDPAKKKRYYKVVGKTSSDTSAANTYETVDGMKYIKVIEENGIDIYVDDHGDIQFKDLSNPTEHWKLGEYDTFGRTDFTTHGYHLDESSANNMLVRRQLTNS